MKKQFKLIIVGIILIIIGFSIIKATESILIEQVTNPNSSWSLEDQTGVSEDEWIERATEEYLWLGATVLLGYAILGIGIITAIIGGIKFIQSKKVKN